MVYIFRKILTIILLVSLPVTLYAECDPNSNTSGEQVVGALLGAAVGGLVGSQIGGGSGKKVAIGAGVLAGGLLGHQIATKMSCKDLEYHNKTTQNSLENKPVGTSSSWQNPDSGHSGTVTPTKTYVAENGKPCREFTQTITVEGQIEEIQATACRQDDGTWQIVDS